MQESLLLVLKFERNQESWPLYQIVPVILGSALHDCLIILQLISLEYVATDIILERVIVNALLLSLSVILDRAHSITCHGALVDRPECLQVVLHTLVVILLIPTVRLSIAELVLVHGALRCVVLAVASGIEIIVRSHLPSALILANVLALAD